MSTAKTPLTVVYDSDNLSSKLEVEQLREKDTDKTMTLVDIASGGKAEVRKSVHVRDADGKVFAGMDAIGAMHDAVGLGGYFRFCRTPGLTSGPSGFFKAKAA